MTIVRCHKPRILTTSNADLIEVGEDGVDINYENIVRFGIINDAV
mgnify:CR=1 FL=1